MLEFWQKHFQMCCRTELPYFYHRSHFQRAVASFSVDVRSCFCWFFHVVTVTDVQQLRHLQRVRSRSADRLSRDFSAGRRSLRFGWASSLLSHVPGAQRRSRWLMQTLIKKCCHLAFLFVAFFFFFSSHFLWSVVKRGHSSCIAAGFSQSFGDEHKSFFLIRIRMCCFDDKNKFRKKAFSISWFRDVWVGAFGGMLP